MEFDGFDWDEGNRAKCQKHGVSIAEIESLFSTTVRVGPDAEHSSDEERFRALGAGVRGRHLFVVFTWRERDGRRYLRPVSARYMHKKEVAKHA
jgi:uncharacterized DUF497 family protein